jgi:hypothetical protein
LASGRGRKGSDSKAGRSTRAVSASTTIRATLDHFGRSRVTKSNHITFITGVFFLKKNVSIHLFFRRQLMWGIKKTSINNLGEPRQRGMNFVSKKKKKKCVVIVNYSLAMCSQVDVSSASSSWQVLLVVVDCVRLVHRL